MSSASGTTFPTGQRRGSRSSRRRAPRATSFPRRSSTSLASRSGTAGATSTPGFARPARRSTPRPPARASAAQARRRAAEVGRCPVRRRAHPRRRHAVEVDAHRGPWRGRAGEGRPPSRQGPLGPARDPLARRVAAPQDPRHRPLLELRPHPRGRAALRRIVHLLPHGRPRTQARRARRGVLRAPTPAARLDAP